MSSTVGHTKVKAAMSREHAIGRLLRALLVLGWAGLAIFAPASRSTAPTSDRTAVLNVASLGGELDVVFKKVFKPFEEQNHVTIHWTPGVSAENVAKVAASRASPEFDVALVENLAYYQGSIQGLWAPVDESVVTHYKDLFPQAQPRGKDAVGVGFFYAGFFYQPQEFAKRGWAPPRTWNDLFRPEFCGRIGLMHPNVSYTIHTIIMLAGGDVTKVQDGIARLAKLRDCIPVLEPSAPKLEEKIQLGEYLVGVHGNIRTIYLMKKGYPVKFVYPEDGTVAAVTMAAAVKNAPNAKVAQEFLDWFIRPDSQQQIMEGLFYGPTNRTLVVSEQMKQLGVPDAELMKKMIAVDDSRCCRPETRLDSRSRARDGQVTPARLPHRCKISAGSVSA